MNSIDNILSVINRNSHAILQQIANNVKSRRLEQNLTQAGLASRAGISYSTYRRFERTGEISLRNIVMIAMALSCVNDFEKLFATPGYQNIDDIINTNKSATRKRGKKNE